MLSNIVLSLIALNVILLLAVSGVAIFTDTKVNVLMHIAGHIFSASILGLAYFSLTEKGL